MASRNLFNSVYNLAGAAIPAVVNLLTIPYIVEQLGHDHYGLYTLTGSVMGYFALLDINATSGSVKYVAEFNARGERRRLFEVIVFGAVIYLLIGIVGALSIFLSADVLVHRAFAITPENYRLAVESLQLAALGFLLGQMQVYLNSVPQSLKRYDATAALEVIMGSALPLLSALWVWLGFGLYDLLEVRVQATAIHVLLLLFVLGRLLPDFRWHVPSRWVMKRVASFSGYAYLSRVAALTYQHADKLIIGSMISMSELTFYAVPTTLVNRVLGLSFRLGSVLYPVASELGAQDDKAGLRQLYLSATRYVTCVNTFLVLLLSVCAYPLLQLWIGETFAEKGQRIMAMIAIAMLIDSLTNLPSLFNDGLGYPKKTGLFAIARSGVSLLLLSVLTWKWGIIGAASAHLASSCLMTVWFLFYIHGKSIPVKLSEVATYAWLPTALVASLVGGMGFAVSSIKVLDAPEWILLVSLISGMYLVLSVLFVAEKEHRKEFLRYCKRVVS